MSELSFVTAGDPAKILYLNPMRDGEGNFKTTKEWVVEIIRFFDQQNPWDLGISYTEQAAWHYNEIHDAIAKARDLCEYLFENIDSNQELAKLYHSLNNLVSCDYPKSLKEEGIE